jgi:4'-phosphopantetheinyl transferase
MAEDASVADLWVVDPADVHEPALLSRYAELLSAQEAGQHEGYRLEKLRHQYLVSRVLVRSVLARRLGVSPAEVVLRTTSAGRPELAAPGDRRRANFNLSHTDGLIVLAVTDGPPIGVDVERYDRDVDVVALARRFFAPAEHEALLAAAEERRRELFLAYWTLKEAFLKARGVGIADGLGSIAFAFDPGATIRALTAAADGWQFVSWEPTPSHRAAVAMLAPELVLCARRAVPLVREETVAFNPIAASPRH